MSEQPALLILESSVREDKFRVRTHGTVGSRGYGKTALGAIACFDDHERGRGALRINCLCLDIARYCVQFVAIGAFAMKHCISITAAQQLFTDTTSTLVAYIQHK